MIMHAHAHGAAGAAPRAVARATVTLARRTITGLTTLALLVLMLTIPAASHAHTSLQSSTPAEDEVVAEAPSEVVLQFGDEVRLQPGAVKVFGPDGERADAGEAEAAPDGTVTTPVDAAAPGTYFVAWRVISPDGHDLTGTFGFHVGERSEDAASKERADAAGRASASVVWGYGIARFVLLVGLLAVVGGGLFSTLVVPGWQPRGIVPWQLVLLVAIVAVYVFDAATVRGASVSAVLDAGTLAGHAGSPAGRAMLLMGVLSIGTLVSAIMLAKSEERLGAGARTIMAMLFIALGASLSLWGHAAAAGPLRMSLDMVHIVAGAVWLGGLLQLRAMAPVARQHVADVERFSKVAFAGVMVLLATGAYAAIASLGLSPQLLVESQYGRIVLAKLLLYVGTMPMAYMNKSVYVPAIARRPADASALLRQYVFRELFLVLVIVAITAWLVRTPPPS